MKKPPLPCKLLTLSRGAFADDFKVFVLASVVSRSPRFLAVGFFVVATLIHSWGQAAKSFTDGDLARLTAVFVILVIGGFWFVGKGARAAARLGSGWSERSAMGTSERRVTRSTKGPS